MKISLGCDHGGFVAKEAVKKYLIKNDYEVVDVGTNSTESCNYAEFGIAAAKLVADKECDFGVLICSSGEGISIAANKVKGIRCGIGYNDDVSRLLRQHNDANMIAFGAKFMNVDDIIRRVNIFLHTDFEGGRHCVRVNTIINEEK
ncbi:MAG: RpiB/LacA/LacB family sugar-phosphate isomerase [Bacilli bacterium]